MYIGKARYGNIAEVMWSDGKRKCWQGLGTLGI